MWANEEEGKKVGKGRGGKRRREERVEEESKEREEKRSKVVFVLHFAFFPDSPQSY